MSIPPIVVTERGTSLTDRIIERLTESSRWNRHIDVPQPFLEDGAALANCGAPHEHAIVLTVRRLEDEDRLASHVEVVKAIGPRFLFVYLPFLIIKSLAEKLHKAGVDATFYECSFHCRPDFTGWPPVFDL